MIAVVMSSTAAPMLLERLAGLLDGRDAVLGAPRAVVDDADDVGGLGLDLADQARDLAAALLGLLGQLADLLGDDGEAAALLAGASGLDGGVERQQVRLLGDAGDRVDDPADLLRASRELLDRGRDLGGGVGDAADRPGRLLGGVDALAGDLAGLLGGAGGLLGALGARRGPPRRPRAAASRAVSTMRTWRSAPWATSPTADAISPTARPASSEVEAICCDAAASVARRSCTARSDRAGWPACRCSAATERWVLVEHRVERLGQTADLVARVHVDRLGDRSPRWRRGRRWRRPPGCR